MGRGHKQHSDEVKALRGNPGQRRLQLQQPETVAVPVGISQISVLDTAPIPAFLDRPEEQVAFRTIVEDYLQRRVARAGDLAAYGRWSVYLQMFIEVKRKVIAEQAHVATESKSPLMRVMKDLEEMLRALEDRLGLNPMARQQIIRQLAAAAPTKLADDVQPADTKRKSKTQKAADAVPEMPLAFLAAVK